MTVMRTSSQVIKRSGDIYENKIYFSAFNTVDGGGVSF